MILFSNFLLDFSWVFLGCLGLESVKEAFSLVLSAHLAGLRACGREKYLIYTQNQKGLNFSGREQRGRLQPRQQTDTQHGGGIKGHLRSSCVP